MPPFRAICAKAAATAKLAGRARGNDGFEATFPAPDHGRGHILATGFRTGVNRFWPITTAPHELDNGGFSTAILAERPGAD